MNNLMTPENIMKYGNAQNATNVGVSDVKRLVMRYQHDCDCCKPLGQFGENDLYYCEQHGTPTVIARYGNDGPDYTSGMGFADVDPRLGIARMMAVAMGLYDA